MMKVNFYITKYRSLLGALIAIGIFCLSSPAIAQSDKTNKSKRHWTVYGGIGPNYYFNNLVLLKNEVNELNYSFVGRIMWEPEHLLSIGFETGYYRLYSMNLTTPVNTKIKNSAIPIQFVISMKFLKSFYGNFAIGRSILINDITTSGTGDYDATTLSLADFSTTIGYRRKLNERFSLGLESKFYWASKADDKNVALLFMAGYRLH